MTQKTCTNCGQPKAAHHFARCAGRADGLQSWCKTCLRIAAAEYRRTERYRETITAYRSRPEVKAKISERDRRPGRREAHREINRAWATSLRGRLFGGRRSAHQRLKRGTTEEQRAQILALIAVYDSEIARLDAEHESRVKPRADDDDRRDTNPYRGVYRLRSGRYAGQFRTKGHKHHCGTFDAPEDAAAAVDARALAVLGVEGYSRGQGKVKRPTHNGA